jgi:benzodiazapine receptor
MRSVAVLLLLVAACLGTGYLGSMATAESVRDWYPTIAKPPWTPPDAVFGPVWSMLYVTMAVAAWMVWRETGPTRSRAAAFSVFGLQLALNLSWSILFFGLERPGAALAEIVLLWLAILWTVLLFARHSRTGAWLLTPYLGWVTFAAALNFEIWRLNG